MNLSQWACLEVAPPMISGSLTKFGALILVHTSIAHHSVLIFASLIQKLRWHLGKSTNVLEPTGLSPAKIGCQLHLLDLLAILIEFIWCVLVTHT